MYLHIVVRNLVCLLYCIVFNKYWFYLKQDSWRLYKYFLDVPLESLRKTMAVLLQSVQ